MQIIGFVWILVPIVGDTKRKMTESAQNADPIPIQPAKETDFSASLHMIPRDKVQKLAAVAVKVPENAAQSFRGTPFASLYDEALNLLRSKNITPEELGYLSRALNQLLEKRAFNSFYVRGGRLSDVDDLEKLIAYWAKQGENLPRKRADIVRNIDSFAVCEREGKMVGCANLFVYDSGLAEIRSLGVQPDVQRQGQGRAIVEFLLARARSLDIDKVFVLTRSAAFFERVGFSLTSIEALPEKARKDCDNCPKKNRCDELAYEYNLA